MNCSASSARTFVRVVSSTASLQRDGQVLRVRVAVERDDAATRELLVRLEDHFAVAEGDAVARLERRGAVEPHAVEQRAVDAAAVAHEPVVGVEDDLRVAAREIAILDRDRAVGGAAERDQRAGRARRSSARGSAAGR